MKRSSYHFENLKPYLVSIKYKWFKLIIHIILIFRVRRLNSLWQASFWHYKDLAP